MDVVGTTQTAYESLGTGKCFDLDINGNSQELALDPYVKNGIMKFFVVDFDILQKFWFEIIGFLPNVCPADWRKGKTSD